MNKIQLAGIWLGCLALSVYLCMKQEISYYIASAGIIVLAGIITFYATRRQEHEHYSMPHEYLHKNSAGTNEAGNSQNSVLIPGPFYGGTVVFNKESLSFRGKTYNYRNITGMYYNTVNLIVHGIPASQTYVFGLRSAEGNMAVSFASVFYLNNNKLKDLYAKLIGLAMVHIEPVIAANVMREMFKNGKAVKIGPLEFTNKGYSGKKMFGGIEHIAWDSRIYIPQIFEGYVYVYRDKNGKPQKMKTLSMQTVNAVVLPNLVQLCYDEFNNIKREV